jgi:fluoroquinolone transport system permease protein
VKTLWAAFRQFLRAIWSDAMLAACLFAPVLLAAVLRFGVPALETVIQNITGTARVLTPYYALFDLFLSLMTPLMLCFAGVMVVLEEIDDGTAKYLMVTPLRKAGYLLSRLALVTVVSIPNNVALVAIFRLSAMPLGINVIAAVVNALVCVSVAMLVIGFSKNKVEGMAVVKMSSGVFFLGYIAAYFLAQPLAFAAGVLPGYWLALMARDNAPLWALPAVAVACLWIAALYGRFRQRVLR